VRGEQEIIVRYEPDAALATIPHLLHDRKDRQKLLELAEKLLADRRVQDAEPSSAQLGMLDAIRALLPIERASASRSTAAKPAVTETSSDHTELGRKETL
jgi:hypothetical protein